MAGGMAQKKGGSSMLSPILSRNPHGDRLPAIGDIVIVKTRELQQGHRFRKFQVVSFPGVNLKDAYCPRANTHLVNLEALENPRNTATVSGFWCEVIQ